MEPNTPDTGVKSPAAPVGAGRGITDTSPDPIKTLRGVHDLPSYYLRVPELWPVGPVGYRQLAPLVREYLNAIMDMYMRDDMPELWACYVVALGKLYMAQPKIVLGKSMLHDLGKSKREALKRFVARWESLGFEKGI